MDNKEDVKNKKKKSSIKKNSKKEEISKTKNSGKKKSSSASKKVSRKKQEIKKENVNEEVINTNVAATTPIIKNDDIEVKEINVDDINKMVNEEKYEELEKKVRKYNVIEPFIVIILLLICFFLLYKFILVSPKAIINSATTEVLNKVTKIIDGVGSNKLGKKYSLSASASISSTNESLSNLSNYSYKFNLNKNSDKIVGDFKGSNNELDVLSLLYEIKDDDLLLKSESIYYYPLKFKKITNTNVDFEKWKKSIIKIKNIVNDELEKKNTLSNKEIISINGQNIDTNVLNLSYNKDESKELILNIINNIKDDEEIVEGIANLYNTNVDSVLEMINSVNMDQLNSLEIKLYTKGFMRDVIGLSINANGKEIIGLYNFNNVYQIDIDKQNNDVTMVLCDNNIVISKGSIKIFTLVLNEYNGNVFDADYIINLASNKCKGTIHIDKKDDYGKINFSIIDSNDSTKNLELVVNYSINDEPIMENYDFIDTIFADDLTNDEIESIINSIKSILS